jgi:hypothetical protein
MLITSHGLNIADKWLVVMPFQEFIKNFALKMRVSNEVGSVSKLTLPWRIPS